MNGGLHQALAQYGWMDGCGYLLAISPTRAHSERSRCRPLRRLILVFFTVNSQWSHQRRYEPEISATYMNERRRFLEAVACKRWLLKNKNKKNLYVGAVVFNFLVRSPSSADYLMLPFNPLPLTTKAPVFPSSPFKYILYVIFKGDSQSVLRLTEAHQRAGEKYR